jgi:hypothetical protein
MAKKVEKVGGLYFRDGKLVSPYTKEWLNREIEKRGGWGKVSEDVMNTPFMRHAAKRDRVR